MQNSVLRMIFFFFSVNVSLLQAQANHRLAIVAGTVTLPCPRRFGGPVRWLYVKSEHSSQDVISKDNVTQSKYTDAATVVQSAKDYNLSLHNVQFNQSGFYICIEDGLLFSKTPYLLTVLGKLCYSWMP
jgi:Immunoglobulin V-set domain